MSITRLQQARQMYALGQRVAKTMDGSRPGYRGDDAYGGGRDPSGPTGDNNREQYGAAGQYSNPPSSPSGGEVDRPNPHTDSGTSKTTTVTGDRMKSAARDFIQTLNTNNAIEAAKTNTKFTPFDNPFAPTKTNPFSLKSALFNIGLMAINPALAAKYSKAKSLYNAAKFAGKLATDIGLTDKNVIDSFTGNLSDKFSNFNTGKKSTTKDNTTNKGGDGDGIASLENQAGNYDEYILLLQKLQSGNISDSERNRYNVLKNMLGI
tara:strand:+ start:7 stop:798 length:792 start_codon:yes stop_codon:yes gene_type:complete